MIPEILKTEINKKAWLNSNVSHDEFWWIRLDDLKEILEKYFEEKTPY